MNSARQKNTTRSVVVGRDGHGERAREMHGETEPVRESAYIDARGLATPTLSAQLVDTHFWRNHLSCSP